MGVVLVHLRGEFDRVGVPEPVDAITVLVLEERDPVLGVVGQVEHVRVAVIIVLLMGAVMVAPGSRFLFMWVFLSRIRG